MTVIPGGNWIALMGGRRIFMRWRLLFLCSFVDQVSRVPVWMVDF